MGLPRLYGSHVYRLLALFKQLDDQGVRHFAIDRAKQALEANRGEPQKFDIDTARMLFTHIVDALVDELAALDFDTATVTFESLEYIADQHRLYPASVDYYRKMLFGIRDSSSPDPESPLDRDMRERHERGLDGSGFKKLFVFILIALGAL